MFIITPMKKPISLDQNERIDSPHPNLNTIPESVGKKIMQVLNARNIQLVYEPNLENFSKKGKQFMTFPQLKCLLKDLSLSLDPESNPDWEKLFEQLDLTEEEKAELQAIHQERLEKFSTAMQEEHLTPRDFRSLKNSNEKNNPFPLLSEALADQKLTSTEHRQLMTYF